MPRYNGQKSTYQMLENKDQKPVNVDPKIANFLKDVGKKILEDNMKPFIDLCQHPKEVMKNNFEYAKGMIGSDPTEMLGKAVMDIALNEIEE